MARAKSDRVARLDFDLAAVMDLQKTLASISDNVRSEVIGDMVNEGAKPVVRAIKSKVAVGDWDLANLRESIKAGVRKNKRKGTAVAYVGPEVGAYFKGGKKLNKKKDDLRGSSGPSRYAHLVEFGHAARDGSRVEAKPFMRPGTDESINQVQAKLVVGFQKGLTRAARKFAKRMSKGT